MVEFDHFKTQAGLPSFVLSPTQWVEKTHAIGIFSKAGRYGDNTNRVINFKPAELIQTSQEEFEVHLNLEFTLLIGHNFYIFEL